MNFVIFSYNFLPQADAEAFCATRFASALARSGHNVTVITMEWPHQVSDETYHALVANELNIVQVPFSHRKNSPIKSLLWYGHQSQMAVDVPQSVVVTKRILKSIERPILITRSHPIMCTMVGLKTYKYAYKWIAHFSDPMPWQSYANTLGHKLLRRQEIKILRNAFSKADGISVTCKHVCRYFKEIYGHSFDLNKVLVTTHIGDYRLDLPPTPTENEGIERILLHPGTIYARRGGTVICQVMQQFEKEGVDCRFVQIGEVDLSIKDLILNSKNIEVYDTSSLEKSVELRKKAKAIFIPDFESDLDYSPFILSKFVYQIMSNKPIVLYSKSDCEMHDYAVQFPEAGIFFAEEGNVPSLKKAICQAMDCDTSLIDRTRIRKCFSEEKIIKDFFIALDKLIGEDASYHSL